VCFICIYHLWGLPLPEDADTEHPKVKELHELLAWSEGMVWCSPERHGSMSSIFKSQIDWIPLAGGAIRATQVKTLAFYDRIVDVMEELFKFTLLTRGQSKYLTDRYSERKESAEELSKRVNQRSL
jgi:arsenic resistance protein ArsH